MDDRKKIFFADFAITVIAIIWGLSFVFQKMAVQHIPPLIFNSVRYFIGGTLILIIFLVIKKFKKNISSIDYKSTIFSGIVIGLFLFGGSVGQQTGVIWTTAGKAGFITGFYVLLVPLFAILLKKEKFSPLMILASILVLIGLFFISDIKKDNLNINRGDLIILGSSLFWAGQIIAIDHFAKKNNIFILIISAFFTCATLSGISSLIFETIDFSKFKDAIFPLIYLSIFSTGIAYSVQFYCQKITPPSHASLIFSTEALYAFIGGILILKEPVKMNLIIGGVLMLLGIILSSLRRVSLKKSNSSY